MGSRRGIVLAAAATAALLVASGCSSSGGSSGTSKGGVSAPAGGGSSASSSIAGMVPSSIKSKGSVNVATPGNTPPEEFTQSGKLVGYEIDLVKAVTGELGLTPQFKTTQFASIIPGMQAKRYDLAVGQFGINTDREKVVDMVSIASLTESFGVINSSGIKKLTLATLCGHSVSILTGSEEQKEATDQSKKCTSNGQKAITIHTYPDAGSAYLAVQSGRAEVYWLGSTAVGYAIQKSHVPGSVVGTNLAPTPTAILVQKDSGLAPVIEKAMQQLIVSGQYATIMKKWGLAGAQIKTSELNPHIATP